MRLFASERFEEHATPPGHPERPERAVVFTRVAAAFADAGGVVSAPRPATRDELARVHTAAYLDDIASRAGRATKIDDDTFTSPESHEIACLAAGAAIDAAVHAWKTGEPAMAMVRPPGHHAEPHRAMGFCLYNNVAVAAAALRAAGVARVAIVDFDVHHGNGTQVAFYSDASVLFVSSQQFPYWPGTGSAAESGEGAGRGFTVNIPLPAGTGDAGYELTYATQVVPALQDFKPDVILVSAGFDAHIDDPLAGMRVTTAGFRNLMAILDDAARQLCGRRIALVTEGGYDLAALRACLDTAIEVFGG
jgi:acetoin utilization deacetylase AcuC-like enzyme